MQSNLKRKLDSSDHGNDKKDTNDGGNVDSKRHRSDEPTNAYINDETAVIDGWYQVRHKSGMYCYVHQESGIVSWSRPYRCIDPEVSQVVLDCKFIFHRQSICFIMTEP
jgi:hypothetical protein